MTTAVLAMAKFLNPSVPTNQAAGDEMFGQEGGIDRVLELVKLKEKKQQDNSGNSQAVAVNNPVSTGGRAGNDAESVV